ncbi:SgcJ/EcaC family oxidoreductase [Streptomyces sp. SID13666]|uniref:SgcJ/EcaC family oxidoreductase n=1 Tax=Streptomyces TaxID=1883 RepID=UPI0013C1F279|nr:MULTISPECIES: SgcJ/EcaC family oxidoreductase [Streptomyces]NEA57583.1 SgcJ/EcaC family oxidoreductase [Streptomyces sp. SID13666]NEA70913.1 SgcJ/EcaC family oxidoreductase [Streptomyces sp. SID13588]
MRRHIRSSIIAGLGIVVLAVVVPGGVASGAMADTEGAGHGHGSCYAEKAALADVPQRVSRAWVAHDLTAFGDVFTEDASFIVPGEDTYLKSRDEIRAYMSAIFTGPYKDVLPVANVLNVKCISKDVGIVVTQGGLKLPGEIDVPPERVGRQTWTIVKQGHEWRDSAYQNSRIMH